MISPDMAGALQAVLQTSCESGRIDGAALAIDAGDQAVAFVAGQANLRERVTVTPETLFHIGSVTKVATADLTWRLIDSGLLSIDEPVIDAAPELGHIATLADRRVTIARLLSHTSGLDGDVMVEAGRSKDVLRRFMSQISAVDSLFEPGAHFSYANVAYNILARITEVRGGVAFEDSLGDLLRKTYGLSQVAITPEEKLRHRTAVHISCNDGAWTPSYFGPYSNIGSGTILAMSMPDLARWGLQLLDTNGGRLRRDLTRPAVRLPFSHRYEGWGCGMTLLDGLGERLFGHDGGTASTATFLRVVPGARAAWAFAATGALAVPVYRQIEGLLREAFELPAPARRVTVVEMRDIAAYEGCYQRHGMTFMLSAEGGGALRLRVSGSMSSSALDGLLLRPLNRQVFATTLPAIDAAIWVSFHEFEGDQPQLFFVLERMARRTEARVP
jgi:CubicO group peptidase (beta-lactamase class C family)